MQEDHENSHHISTHMNTNTPRLRSRGENAYSHDHKHIDNHGSNLHDHEGHEAGPQSRGWPSCKLES